MEKRFNKIGITQSLLYLLLFLYGCIFSSDNVRERNVVGNFYVFSFAKKNDLLYKTVVDKKQNASGLLLVSNIDSIGQASSSIIGFSKGKYFLLDTASKAVKFVSSLKGVDNAKEKAFNLIPVEELFFK